MEPVPTPESEPVSVPEVKVIVKIFLPGTRWTWYVCEYDREEDIRWRYGRCGLAKDCDEFGTVWLHDLETTKNQYSGVEQDLHWNPETTLQDSIDSKVY